MAFKFIAFAACLAFANAGNLLAPAVHYSPASAVSSAYISQPLAAVHAAPAIQATYAAPVAHATYAAAPVAIHAPAVGATHQSVLRSLGGNQAVSHYSKAVDSAFSTVRKYDTRITNDAVSYGHAPVAYAAAPAYQSYAAPAIQSYAAAPVVAKTYAAPAYQTYSAPAYQSYSAPAYQTYAAPAVHSYAAAPVVAKTYAAPAYQSYAAPAYQTYAHAPVASYAAAAPVVKSVNYSPAVAVAHTTFTGLGAQYAW